MEAIVGEAMKNNLALQVSGARVEAAAGAARIAGASLKPQVGASGMATNNFEDRGAALGISWELDVWGRLASIAAAGQAAYEGAQLDYEFARQSLAAQVAKSYFLVIETHAQQKLTEDNVKVYKELLRVVGERQKIGRISNQDVSLAKADLSQAEERLREAQAAHGQAKRSLEVLLGRFPSAELKADQFPAVPPPPPAGAPSDMLERRPDIAAAERRVRQAYQQLRVAKLAQLPSFSLTAAGGAASDDLSNMLGLGDSFFSVGGNFVAPIYTGGALKGEIDIATAEQKAAFAQYGQAALNAFKEVQDALSNETFLKEREQFLQSVVADNEEALRLRRIEYDAGKGDLLDVLSLQAKVNGARSAAIFIHNARLGERINLHLALGGDFEAPPTTAPSPTTRSSGGVAGAQPDAP
jgi:NodT family efflux transporter outer membrane factor (OMF) lipoprotein